MAQRANLEEVSHPLHEAYACLLSNGLDGAGEALRILVNEASRIERAQHLQAMPYERSAQRVDQANGYKPKGKLDFGPWEQIFYGEFDGRRNKRVLVKVIGE